VGLGPAPVVRLEGALAHSEAPGIWYFRLSMVRALSITRGKDRLGTAVLERRWPRGGPEENPRRAHPSGGRHPPLGMTPNTRHRNPAGRQHRARRRPDRATVRARDGHGQTDRQLPNHSVCWSAAENGGPTRPTRQEIRLTCGQRLAARPAGLLASRVVGRLPHPSRARASPPSGSCANSRGRLRGTLCTQAVDDHVDGEGRSGT
jgi:hypothetical protein